MKLETLGDVCCRGCNTVIGPLLRIKGRVAMYRAGFTVYAGFFRCSLCGVVFHFDGGKIDPDRVVLNGKLGAKVARTA